MAVTLTQRLTAYAGGAIQQTLSLTAEERTRSRHRFDMPDGQVVFLQLPRGTVLQNGDVLQSDDGQRVQIISKAEPVLTVQAETPLALLQAAYHLGNRHVPLEITSAYLRLSPDPVLRDLLQHRGLQITEEMQPFQPEMGAYGHSH
ncbi:urease accessory protein UreE [Leptolyngbya sp. FACHB-36]|uniref:urease accessory protein UreE n=1 Tax=Leptolyngbya sp. FACHB-36 TaxID=2692808 RepID=UPI001680069D|nr:urease accessory protein UreE [Leptolyngbya sp. FACHB-36]MBD2022512.1 urease accessory protein UreE [Leptolyngbya sp. FACHB-36]